MSSVGVGRRGVTGVVLVVGALLVACTSPGADAPPASSAGSSAGPPAGAVAGAPSFLQFPSVDRGVLSSAVPTPAATSRTYASGGDAISIVLRRCRTSWPGHIVYELGWTPPADLALPVTVTLELGHGDVSLPSTSVDATLERAGDFTVVTDEPLQIRTRGSSGGGPGEDEPWRADRRVLDAARAGPCGVEARAVRTVDITNESHGIEVDPTRPSVVAPDRSVEALLPLVDPFAADDPLRPLAALLADPTWPAVDELWIAPTERIASFVVRRNASCVSVTTAYGDDPETRDLPADGQPSPPLTATITQRAGCPGREPTPVAVGDPDEVIRIVDDVWDVEVKGRAPSAQELIGKLARLPVTSRGASVRPAAFDPGAYLDAWFQQHPAQLELGRAPWQGGLVAVTAGDGEGTSRGVIGVGSVAAIPGPPLDAGSTRTQCRDYASDQRITSVRGHVVIAARDNVARVELTDGSSSRTIDLVPGKQPGYRYGFIGDPPLRSPGSGAGLRLRFLDAAGAEVPCVQ